ncbi:complex I NDUFA9 subunit family protein [Schlegelella sp. S2-27]|uniref:Complex I NDUFA9 subunit family protein n=1 Tax=Caldimonas mangrovi TaxID=2944811 RepID=A0ABT0YKR1_9BURK|nr:complex I NDUFA9 subunit family protein [Caldimonas mangrovi]
MGNIVVLGGTGFVGTHVCEKLVERSGGAGALVVPTRRIGHARHLQPLPSLVPVQADVHDDAQLERLLSTADAVINLVAVLHGSESQFQRVHVELPRRLARACATTGVRRLIHVSSLGAAPDAPSRYQRSKAAGEAALRSAPGLECTILRPSVIFGEQDRFLNQFASLQKRLPLMPLARAAAKFQPVWVEDVARAIVACVDRRDSVGQTYECVGPRVYTLAELVRCAGHWSGHPRPVLPLPDALGRVQAMLLELLPGEPLMSRDNLDSMHIDNVATGGLPDLHALGIEPMPLEGIAPLYLGRVGSRSHLNLFRMGARRG